MSYSPPSSAKPFTLNIPDQDIDEWRQLLTLSKLAPETWEGSHEDGRYGVTHKWLRETKDYWLNTYDWRAEERRINSFPNYRMAIDGVDVHFVALFSSKKDAIPIQLLHGWPGSFVEFLPMLNLIRTQYPDAKDLPYHIIVPSLPGYPLSPRPTDRDWTMEESSTVLNQLMVNLGFTKYIAQGGDVGSFVAQSSAARYDECVGIHLNMFTGQTDNLELSELEKKSIASAQAWQETGIAYAQEHATRPSTIGSVLSSNPLALLAWIAEKLIEWTDTTPPLDHILTNITLYWYTSSILTSLYPYRQLFSKVLGAAAVPNVYISKPTGFSFFPHELSPGFKRVVEKGVNLVTYEEHEHGGHFAALEQPEALWGDVEAYVKIAWGKV
ncbi:putative epoxide hydrolase [Didymella exigua CBS 183.55]|uniref:Putative epoxide hydrolase n=1 Tax=Didymella exigua CBS 183.55 TaxID=1150837 RepID=A0A6A5RKZ4_9PLEO|nr:putative epoxide hydrolase [Didymella exigua CBS 183.55]KAF1926207.1 putative epoxide hydrolase [Didymella exigua CBS 183.55]